MIKCECVLAFHVCSISSRILSRNTKITNQHRTHILITIATSQAGMAFVVLVCRVCLAFAISWACRLDANVCAARLPFEHGGLGFGRVFAGCGHSILHVIPSSVMLHQIEIVASAPAKVNPIPTRIVIPRHRHQPPLQCSIQHRLAVSLCQHSHVARES